MRRFTPFLCSSLAAVSFATPLVAQAACDVRSGPKTAALVELYTSEGCSSCPPADKQMSRLEQDVDADAHVVPLALHVGYWDSIGWKDPYAQPGFEVRQRWLVQINQHQTVYTPHFFVSGGERRGWQGVLRDDVRRVNAQSAAADIRIRTMVNAAGALVIEADATSKSDADASALYLAVTESGLTSHVMAGENGGVTLHHDHVVRRWIGPLKLSGGTAHAQQEITLPADWNRSALAVAGFVQTVQGERSGTVLQAVSTAQCSAL